MDYTNIYRTSYFRVKDEAKYKELWEKHIYGDYLHDYSQVKEDGQLWHAFGGSGSFGWVEDAEEDEDCDFETKPIYNAIADIIEDGCACVIFNVGHEGMRYISGGTTVITPHKVAYDNLDKEANRLMRAAGIDPKTVQTDY